MLQGLMIAGTALFNPSLFGEAKGKAEGQKFEDPSYVAPSPQKVEATAENAFRILFVGNSITRHGANADTKARLGWDHVAGMAATTESNDFAHRLGTLIQKTMPGRKVELYFEGVNVKDREPVVPIPDKTIPHPDLVVIQTGEHEAPGKTKGKIAELYEKLQIKPFRDLKPRPMILCAGVWSPSAGTPYTGFKRDVDEAYKEVCSKYDIPYVSVEKLASDPSCHGWGTSPGVKWHPNDKGMEGYASLLFEAYQKNIKDKNK
jgi:hypothetical protein